MPTLIQAASNGASSSAGGTLSVSATFASAVTLGNTIVVSVGADVGGFSGVNGCDTPSITDTLLNSYTQCSWIRSTYLQGGSAGLFLAPAGAGGSNTVTFTFSAFGGGSPGWNYALTIAEYSGLSSPSLVSSATQKIFGTTGNAPVNLTLTDTNGSTVTVTFGGISGSGGPGTTCCLTVADIASAGQNYLFAAIRGGLNPPTVTSSYSTFTNRQHVASPLQDFFDSAPGVATVIQPQVFVVT
jgi:hypothetical protein